MLEKKWITQAIDWVKSKKFTNIKANIEEYETPTKFTKPDGEEYIPHITCKKTYRKNYIEIATKSEQLQRKISKWKLLSLLAARKSGKLYLLAPKGHITFIRQLVKEYQLGAQVIALK